MINEIRTSIFFSFSILSSAFFNNQMINVLIKSNCCILISNIKMPYSIRLKLPFRILDSKSDFVEVMLLLSCYTSHYTLKHDCRKVVIFSSSIIRLKSNEPSPRKPNHTKKCKQKVILLFFFTYFESTLHNLKGKRNVSFPIHA